MGADVMLLAEEEIATLADLLREPGKAELINGRIVRYMSTGLRHGRIVRRLILLLATFLESYGRGEVLADNVGFAVPKLTSGRESFSPDVSYYDGPEQTDEMDFVQGPPTIAIEVRSKDGYGNSAAQDMSRKRADYFEAGTLIVWDVDSVAECIHAYTANNPMVARTFRRGDVADAETVLPGWRVNVDEIFKK